MVAYRTASISEQVSTLFEKRALRFKRASFFVKAMFVAAGSAVMGVTQFLQVEAGKPLSWVQIAGIAASIVVFFGAVFVLITEDDASEELATARRASEELREAQDAVDAYSVYDEIIDKQVNLYQALMVMRGVIERAVVTGDKISLVTKSLLELTDRLLPVSLGFAQADHWTICIYRAVPNHVGRDKLICAAHNRAIKCEINEARAWEEGVGVSGIAYANRQEIIVPNMHAAGLGSVFNIAAGARPYDSERYRSMAVVPVKVDGQQKPWGVVVATNDRYNHFTLDEGVGLQTAEAVRAVAGMVALAVAACKADKVVGGGGLAAAPTL